MGSDSALILASIDVVKQTSMVLHLIIFSVITKSASKQLHSLCNVGLLVKSGRQIPVVFYFKAKSLSEATSLTFKDNFYIVDIILPLKF